MCKTIKQKVKFEASPEVIYQILVDAKTHAAITGERARIGKKVGDRFATGAAYSSGINVELVPGVRIVQAWRGRDFPPGIFSMAAIELSSARGGGTQLILTHRGVPKKLIGKIERRWRERYWQRIKAYLRGAPQE